MTEPKAPLHQAAATTRGDSFKTALTTPGHEFISDVPKEHGGSDLAPSPMALLTAALAGCTTMTVRSYAHRKGWPVEAVHAEVEHHSPSGDLPERFLVKMSLEGALDADQRDALEKIAHKCPVHKALAGQISVEVSTS